MAVVLCAELFEVLEGVVVVVLADGAVESRSCRSMKGRKEREARG